jgi:hypothetical protein
MNVLGATKESYNRDNTSLVSNLTSDDTLSKKKITGYQTCGLFIPMSKFPSCKFEYGIELANNLYINLGYCNLYSYAVWTVTGLGELDVRSDAILLGISYNIIDRKKFLSNLL